METEGNLAESTFSHGPVRIISSPLKLITLAHFLLLLLLQRMARIKSMENSKLNNDFSRELTKQMNKVSG